MKKISKDAQVVINKLKVTNMEYASVVIELNKIEQGVHPQQSLLNRLLEKASREYEIYTSLLTDMGYSLSEIAF